MKKSKLSILLLFLVMILAISAVSAADTNDTSDSVVQAVDDAPLEEVASDDADQLAATDDTEVLTADDGNNFTSLQTLINAYDTSSGIPLQINKDYTRAASDNDIVIDRNITLYSMDNKKIDANGLGGIFKINPGVNVYLIGLTLVNGNADNGSAIYNEGILTVERCTLSDNNATIGGAVYSTGDLSIVGSTFKNNQVVGSVLTSGNGYTDVTTNYGGAIAAVAGSLDIRNSEFIENTYKNAVWNYGGAIYVSTAGFNLIEVKFKNNKGFVGGAIFLEDIASPVSIQNSEFTGNTALQGGAIEMVGCTEVTIDDSNFTANNKATGGANATSPDGKTEASVGGAIVAVDGKLNIRGCTFEDNAAASDGSFAGAIVFQNGDLNIVESEFISNSAPIRGAVDALGNVLIKRTNFTDNTATAGDVGAVYIRATSTATIDECLFENNQATGNGGAILVKGTATIANSTFTGNTATSGNAIYNLGSIALENNTMDAGANIVNGNGGTITSPVNVTVSADKTTYRIEEVTLTATLTDDNGNVINDTAFNFVFNTPAGLAAIPATFNGNNYTAKFTPTKTGEYNVTVDYVGDITTATFTVYRTLTDLADKIAAANGNPVILDGDYTYNAAYDSAIATAGGIAIDNDVTIDGKGYTIDAKNATRIFNVKADMNITNVTLTNGKTTGLGAAINIATAGNNVRVTYTTFTNNAAKYGSGICDDVGDGSNVYVDNCIFDSNYNTVTGTVFCGAPAIYSWGSLVVNNSVFNNNGLYGLIDGDVTNAAVTTQGDGKIYNSNFTNNRANKGGAICSNRNSKVIDLIVDNCRFINNTGYDGGAVLVSTNSKADIKNSYFENNSAYGFGSEGYTAAGGAICVVGANSANITDCIFKENKVGIAANSSGGAISIENTNVDISDCTFESNSAIKCGGAIDISNKVSTIAREVTISNCNFTNNSAEFGDAIMLRESKTELDVSGSNFTNNGVETDYAVYNMLGTLKLAGNTIDNMIYSDSTVISQINVTTYGATVHYGEKVNLTATITDDNGNLVCSPNFYFVINNTSYGPAVYNNKTKKYEFEYVSDLTVGEYVINVTNADIPDLTYVELGVLSSSPLRGTYTDLQYQIDHATDVLDLTYDFAYNATYDGANFPNGVIINKALTINGNDHSISGADALRIFYIGTFADVAINGVVFKDGKADNGGALLVAGKLSIDNCTFVNNTAVNGTDIYVIASPVAVVFNEDTYNLLYRDPLSSLNKYYADNPREDGIDANGNPVHDSTTPIVGHSWESAITTWMKNITIDGTNYTWEKGYSMFPWIVINMDNYTGYILFKYNGELKFNWTGLTNKQRGVVSVMEDLKMPDYTLTYQYGEWVDKVFDPSLLTVEYVGTSSGRPVNILSTPSDMVTIKNSVFSDSGYSIKNYGTINLENNTVSGTIYNSGIITSLVNVTILNNESIDTISSTYDLTAVVCDDMGNLICDPTLKFVVNDVAEDTVIADNGECSINDYALAKATVYVIDMNSTKAGQVLNVKTAVIRNIVGTFTYAQKYIDWYEENNVTTLNLPIDITYNAAIDGDFKTLLISKNLTVNCNNHEISGNGTYIVAIAGNANVTLNGISFSNASQAIVNNGNLTLKDSTFDNNSVEYAVVNNAVLYLSGNTNATIYNRGNILSKVVVDFIASDDYVTEESYELWVVLKDDSDNKIYDENLKFIVNNVIQDNVSYNATSGKYNLTYTFPSFGEYNVTFTAGIDESYIANATLRFIRGTFTDLQHQIATANGAVLELPYDFTYNADIDGNLTVIDLTSGIDGKGFTINGSDKANGFIVNGDVTIQNTTFVNVAEYAIYNNGKLTLANNTISTEKALIINNATVNGIATIMNGETVNVMYKEQIILTATFTDDKGNLIYDSDLAFTVDGDNGIYNATYENGVYTANYTANQIGMKNVNVVNIGDATINKGLLNVSKADVILTVNGTDIVRKDDETISIKLVDYYGNPIVGANVNVAIYLGSEMVNTTVLVTDINGTSSYVLSGLGVGNYNIVALYGGNEYYKAPDFPSTNVFVVEELNYTTTFTELQEFIKTYEGTNDTLVLPYDYIYNDWADEDKYINGVKISKDITIDGNGTTIDANKTARIFYIEPGVTVTIRNLTFINGFADEGAAIYTEANRLTLYACNFYSNDPTNGSAIFIKSGSAVSVLDVFKDNVAEFGGAIYVDEGAALYDLGSKYINNTATYGGAIYALGNVTISGSQFIDNTVNNGGGAIAIDATNGNNVNYTIILSNFTGNKAINTTPGACVAGGAIYTEGAALGEIIGCEFTNNSAISDNVPNGGAVKVEFGGSALIKDSTFTENIAADSGGAISVQAKNGADCTVIVENCTFTENEAIAGGAISALQYHGKSTVTVKDSHFTGNAATIKGAAIYSDDLSTVTVTGSDFTANAAELGGAIYALGDLTVEESDFNDNGATTGGAIYIDDKYTTPVFNVANCTFTENTVTIAGGAIAIDAANGKGIAYAIANSKFIENDAINTTADACVAGGAIYTEGAALGEIIGCEFTNNSAISDNVPNGGAVKVEFGGSALIKDSTFTENIAADSGGAISVQAKNGADCTVIVENCTFTENEAIAGGAISALQYHGKSTVIVKDSHFTGNAATIKGAAIYSDDLSTVTVTGSDFTANAAELGGAIYALGDLTVEDSNFTGNAADLGGAIYVSDKYAKVNLDVDGCTFTENYVTNAGGAICIDATNGNGIAYNVFDSKFINNTVISSNGSCVAGGAIYTEGAAIGAIVGTEFTENKAVSSFRPNGGAIKVQFGGDAYIKDCTFTANEAGTNGGAISVQANINEDCNVEIVNCTFEYNNATSAGGAISVLQNVGKSTVTINGSKFSTNAANDVGGAIYSDDLSTVTVLNSEFTTNTAAKGAAIYALGDLTVKDSKFTENIADGGAAIFISDKYAKVNLDVDGCTFTENYVTNAGGAILIDATNGKGITYLISNSEFTKNSASNNSAGACVAGGAIYTEGAAQGVIINDNFTSNIAESEVSPNGGAIKVQFGGDALIKGCVFIDNAAGMSGGAINVQAVTDGDNRVEVINCNFTGNEAYAGGAIASAQYRGKSVVIIADSTFTDNNAAGGAGAIYIDALSEVEISGSEFIANADPLGRPVFNLGNLSLSNNVVDTVIYNGGNIITPTYIKVLDNTTTEAVDYGDTVELYAEIVDDNNNTIVGKYDLAFMVEGDNGIYNATFNADSNIYVANYTTISAGKKAVSAKLIGEGLLDNSVQIGILNISRINITEFNVIPGGQDNRILYGENVTIYVTLRGLNGEGLNETFTVVVNNTEYSVTVNDGEGSFNVSGLEPGEYAALGMFPGNNDYNSAYATGVFYVISASNLTVVPNATTAVYGDEILFMFNVTDSLGNPIDTGIVVIDDTYKVIIEDGLGYFDVNSQPDVGNYTLTAVFVGDEYFASSSAVFTFEVIAKEINTSDIEYDFTGDYPDGLNITITAPVDGTYIVDIEGTTVEVEVINGTGNAVVNTLEPNDYTAVITLNDTNYALDNITHVFTYKGAPEFTVEISGTYPTAEIKIFGTPGDYHVDIDGFDTINITVSGFGLPGIATINNISAGNYTAIVSYDTNDKYHGDAADKNFTVDKATSSVTIDPIADVVYGNTVEVTFNIENKTDLGEIEIIDENGNHYGKMINGSSVTAFLPAGEYTIVIYNYASENYSESQANATFEVIKAENLTITYDGDLIVLSGGNVTITVAPDATGYVIIDNDGVTKYGELVNGSFTFEIYDLTAGDYTIAVEYYGDDNYNKTNATKVLTIPKTKVVPIISNVTSEITGLENATFTVTMSDDHADGNISIYVDDVFNQVVVLDKDYANATVTIVGITKGEHVITVVYNGNDNYEAGANATTNITQTPDELGLIVDVDDINVTDVAVINVYTDLRFTGTVNVTINSDNLAVNVVDGYGNITVSGLSYGKHKVNADYNGGDYFAADESNCTFEVFRLVSDMNITSGDVVIDTNLVISIAVGSANGNVTVFIDSYQRNVTLKDGFGNFTIPAKYVVYGNHTIIAFFAGDEYYGPTQGKFNYFVEKAENYTFEVNLTADEINYGENATINVTLPEDANGRIVVSVDGKNVTYGDVVNGTATVTIPADAFKTGFDFIAVTYSDDKYGETKVEKAIYVNHLPSDLTASADNIELGENATIVIKLPTYKDGYVFVELLGKMYSPVDWNVIIENLTEGTYTATVFFASDSVYKDNSTNVTFNVTKVEIPPEQAFNFTTPENSTHEVISVNLPEDATGFLLLDVNGTQTHVPLVDGKANVTVPNLPEGLYNATITYTGDNKYAPITTTKELNVTSNVPENALSIPDSAKSDTPTTYSISLPSDAGGYLEVDVDGTKYAAPLNNGSASVTIPALAPGNHNVTVKYTGDDKYTPVTKASTLNVTDPVYKISNNKNVAALYSAKATYKVLVLRDGKAAGAGEKVTFKFNGKTYTVKTDKKGYATLKLNTKVKVKKYKITATIKGASVKNTVTIKHVIKAKNKKIGKKSKKAKKSKKSKKSKYVKVKVSLKKVNGKYLKGKKITIKFKGKKYKVKTNKKGKATWKLKKSVVKKLKKGKKYKYTVTYGKDKVTKKLKVKK